MIFFIYMRQCHATTYEILEALSPSLHRPHVQAFILPSRHVQMVPKLWIYYTSNLQNIFIVMLAWDTPSLSSILRFYLENNKFTQSLL